MNESLKEKMKIIILEVDNWKEKQPSYFLNYVFKNDNNVLSILKNTEDIQKANGYFGAIPQHLHIYSDRKIEEDNWIYEVSSGRIGKYEYDQISYTHDLITREGSTKTTYPFLTSEYFRKIEASTDQSLKLPRPSNDFIKAYIKAYNEGTCIEEVMVEMFESPDWNKVLNHEPYRGNEIKRVKVKPDNTITISPIEENWEDIKNNFPSTWSALAAEVFGWLKKNYKPPIKLKK